MSFNIKQSYKRFILITVVLSTLLAVIMGSLSCQQSTYSGPVESITVGTANQEVSIPILVAEDQQFFARNGLNVNLRNFETGPQAINSLLRNEVDIASPVTEYVLASQALDQVNIKTIGSFVKLDFVVIIGRKDRSVTDVSQLSGKKIGIIRGTALDFYLGRFLDLHGLNISQVTLENFTSVPQMTDAIVNGDVDAIISVPPSAEVALSKLGSNAVTWKAQSGQMVYQLFIGEDEWIKEHPAIVERFLKAMSQAEEFILQHPEEAKSIAKKKLSLSDDEIAKIWSRNHFKLSLEQALIVAMNDEARWMIDNNLTSETQVPNFLDYVYTEGLEAVKPEAVDIIR